VEQKYPSQNQKKLMYQALVQSILLYGAETWTLNAQQVNKLLATEMDFWRSARKSRKEKVRNGTIRVSMEVRKNILDINEEKWLRWLGHVKRMPGNRIGTRGKAKKRKTQRRMDGVRWSMQTMD
jgi:hypothetical protein